MILWDPTVAPRSHRERCALHLSGERAGVGATLGALVVIPLLVLAGLFIWLKLTEEADDESLEPEPTPA
ncbi:MAG: hypothetical protein ACLQBX_04010 [Candidatus Limnocylindrales bacterium]